ncbi:hypothetical protein [Flavobacterium pallidum]|uniref:Outer membrane protein beta-barrel domain-containing protein n=1 Tax=Flavobacterium pallidum TaxID=2172098 RepID=A0A2S1SHP9_9FLAO|nr:hypothetical protein [Flavobacterium pallidum]AWI25901.1 hypothetical protein HYN49_08305 [Flavobacterium pallidum]
MKKLLLSVAAVLAFGLVSAQDSDGGFKVGIHVGIPMGDAGDLYSANYGADIAYMFPVADSFLLGATTGYSFYSGKEYDLGGVTVKQNGAFIPVAAAAQYSLDTNWFIGADLGYAVYSGDGDGNGGMYYQPKVGFQTETMQFYAGYKGISVEGGSVSSVGVGAAYKF